MSTEGAKVLIVEDNQYEATHLQLTLTQMGHQVIDTVSTGEDCLASINKQLPDLLLVDIVLQGKLSGIDTVERLKHYRHLPVIFLTSYSNDEFIAQAEQTRPYAYLLKPFRQQELEFLIKMCLIRGQIERRLHEEKLQAENKLHQAMAVIEHTSEGIILTDARGRIELVNKAFERITGYSEAEVLGQTPALLSSGRHSQEFYAAMWHRLNTDRSWQGEIWNRRKNGEIYHQWLTISTVLNQRHRASHFIAIFSDISEVKRSEAQLKYQAHHDVLTELANRNLFDSQLKHAIASAARHDYLFAVLFVDLDRFKEINDRHGHQCGDRLLKDVASRLAGSVREADLVARLGGDEFVILLDNIDSADAAAAVADKVVEIIAAPYRDGGLEYHLGCSIGIAVYPNDGRDHSELVRNADTAMYKSKERGGNTFSFYDSQLTLQTLSRAHFLNSFKTGLDQGQFILHYQPMVDIRHNRITGLEALVRWQHPELGLLAPSDFIPQAEASGLIIPLGEWVLTEACRQMQLWLTRGIDAGIVAVNIAGFQLNRSKLLPTLEQVLAITGLPPDRLELELTEPFADDVSTLSEATLTQLRQTGVSIAIDDFGTGATSLDRLKHLPINKLKIDRSLIVQLTNSDIDQAITRAIISLGRDLGLTLVAEGVEYNAQARCLANLGCHHAQGFLYSTPANASDIEPQLRAGVIGS